MNIHRMRMKSKLLSLATAVTALVGSSLFMSVNPASASFCNITGWIDGGGMSIVPWTDDGRVNFGTAGHKQACFSVGLTEDSDPYGWYRIKIRVQETVDLGDQANAWDDAGSTRIQLQPPNWNSWAETTDPVFWNYGASHYLGADANSADFNSNDAHGDWYSQWFCACNSGIAYNWRWRPVYQAHYQPQVFVPWKWEDSPKIAHALQ